MKRWIFLKEPSCQPVSLPLSLFTWKKSKAQDVYGLKKCSIEGMLSPLVVWWKKMCFWGSHLLKWSAASKHGGTWEAEAGEFLSSRLAWASCQAPCPPGLHTLIRGSQTNRLVWVVYVCNLRVCGIESGGLSWVQDYIVSTRPSGDTKHDTVSNDNSKKERMYCWETMTYELWRLIPVWIEFVEIIPRINSLTSGGKPFSLLFPPLFQHSV